MSLVVCRLPLLFGAVAAFQPKPVKDKRDLIIASPTLFFLCTDFSSSRESAFVPLLQACGRPGPAGHFSAAGLPHVSQLPSRLAAVSS
eukprot:3225648-Amphidinium_carterae.1